MNQRHCPKCNSKDVKPDMSGTTSFLHGSVNDWICNNCGYRGLMPAGESPGEQKELEEEEIVYKKPDKAKIFSVLLLITALILAIASYLKI